MSNLTKCLRVALFLFATMITLGVSAQNVTVTGTVSDDFGPVSGATVVEKGKPSNGAATDLNGKYKVSVPKNATLVVSFVGMQTKEIQVKGQTVINVVLQDDAKLLDEVVAIGYGTMKKKDLTGAVATVSSEALTAIPVNTAAEALSGKLAGVNVTTTEGSPDAEVTIRVRGGGSITQSNDPLYIVDGFPVASISDIPASDIEDITVLKDASSTAIYGSRGANGVILVTTKSGKEGKVKVSYNAFYSLKKMAKQLNTLSAGDYARWQYEYAMLKNNGDVNKIDSYTKYFGNYQDIDLFDDLPTNNYQDQTFGRTGNTFNHNLSVTGGSDAIKYSFNYAHINDKAIMRGSNFKRDNFSLKLNTKPSKTTKFDLQARYSDVTVNGGGSNEASSSSSSDRRLRYSVLYQPIPLGAGNNQEDEEIGSSMYHPLTAIADNDKTTRRKNLNMSGSFSWEIFKNFTAKTDVGIDDYDNYDKRFWGLTTYYVRNDLSKITLPDGSSAANKPAASFAQTQRERFRNTNTISYNFKELFGKESKHTLDGLLGHEYMKTKKRVNTDMVVAYPTFFTAQNAWNLTAQGTPNPNGGIVDLTSPEDKMLSYFTRWNYNYASKYYLTFTFRADASSKFSSKNRWGYFPSASSAWRISDEAFMEGTKDWLDDLKLRLSFGTSGNNNIDPGYLRQELTSQSIQYVNGYSAYFGPTKRMANPNLKWETTITRNIGIDYSLFGSKLNGSIDLYYNSTKDLLMEFPIGGSYDTQYRNIGNTSNKGIEFSFNYDIVNKKNWGIAFNGNIGWNVAKITKLGRDAFTQESRWNSDIGQDFYIQEGKSVGQIYGYVADGRYELSDFTGYDDVKNEWILKPGVINDATLLGSSSVRPGDMKVSSTRQHWDAAQNAWVWNSTGAVTDELGNVADGKVTRADADKSVIGNTAPKVTGGFGLSARAYGFDLAATFTYSIGNDIYNANKVEYTTANRNSQYYNMIDKMSAGKRWTNIDPETGLICNDPARLAKINEGTTMWSPYMQNYTLTSWAVEDGSFLRLQTLTLGYTLPKSFTQKLKIENLRFYATCNNVFCLTKYSGFDPEVSTMRRNGSMLTPGVDYSAYPKSRQFVFGLNLNF